MLRNVCVPQPVFGWQQNWVNFVSDTTVRSDAPVSTSLPFLNIAHFCSVATGFEEEDLTAQPSVGHCIILYS